MRPEPQDKPKTLRDRIAPMGLSVLINACLLLILARAFTVTGGAAQRYLAVELQVPARPVVRSIPKPQPKPIVLPSPPKPAPPSRAPERKVQEPVKVKPTTAVLPAKMEARPAPPRPVQAHPVPRTQEPPEPATVLGNPGGSGTTAASGPGAGVSTSGSGPGIYSPPGNGSGSSGQGVGSGPGGRQPGHGQSTQPPKVRKQRPPAPEPPKPEPKGESRSARISRQSKPAYPPDAREEGVEGTVVLSVTVGPSGKVTSARVENGSGDRRLDRAAVEAVERWTYEPCLEDGKAIASTMRVRVQFKLE